MFMPDDGGLETVVCPLLFALRPFIRRELLAKWMDFSFFFSTICLIPSCSEPEIGLCCCIAGLIGLARRSSRSLLAAPNACRCKYPVAETAMAQRLPLCQGKPNIAQGFFIQFTVE